MWLVCQSKMQQSSCACSKIRCTAQCLLTSHKNLSVLSPDMNNWYPSKLKMPCLGSGHYLQQGGQWNSEIACTQNLPPPLNKGVIIFTVNFM